MLGRADFKPDNVLIDNDGWARVVDFGLASRNEAREGEVPSTVELPPQPELESQSEIKHGRSGVSTSLLDAPLTEAGTMLGTPAYMSPEQHLRRAAGPASDQFSFFVALHEAVYGLRPFAGRDQKTLAFHACSGRVIEPPEGAHVPAWVRRVILRGLAPIPEERWPSMDAAIEALSRDPAQSRRRVAMGALAVVAATGVAVLIDQRGAEHQELCAGAEPALAEVWSPARGERLKAALLGTGLSFAEDAWLGTERRLNAYGAAWVTMHTEACEATAVRGEQSPELLDLRMSCLQRRLAEMNTTIEVLSDADEAAVTHAVQTVTGLRDLQRCADADALRSRAPPPEDPVVAAAVESIRARVSKVETLESVGRYTQGQELATALLEEARALPHRPSLALVGLKLGRMQGHAGDYDGARATLLQSFLDAQATSLDSVALQSASELLFLLGNQLGRHEEADLWVKHARALVDRIGERGQYAANLESYHGVLLQQRGQYKEAAPHLEQALSLLEAEFGPESLLLGPPLNNLGVTRERMNDLAGARAAYERAMAIWAKELGPEHPVVASVTDNLGSLSASEGDFEKAQEFHKRALALRRRALGPDHPEVGITLNNLGSIYRNNQEPGTAFDYFQEARGVFERSLGPEHLLVAVIMGNIAEAELELGLLSDARVHLERALELFAKHVPDDHPYIAFPQTTLGRLAHAEGKLEEGRVALEKALEIRRENATAGERAETLFALGVLLGSTEGSRAEGAARVREAAREYEDAGPGYARQRAEVADWLERNDLPDEPDNPDG